DLPKILNKVEKGYNDPENMTMEEYFNKCLERKKRSVQHGTYEHYESYMRKHIIPGLGRWNISKMESDHIESFINEIDEKELSQRSKKHIYRILSSALLKGRKHGIKDGIMDDVEAPKVNRQDIDYWTQEEVSTFMRNLKR